LDCPGQGASSEWKKKLPGFFSFREIRKKPKNPYFWLPQQKMGSMAGTFSIPEFNSLYTITDSNLVRIGDKKFFEKKHEPLPFHFGKSFTYIEYNNYTNSLESKAVFFHLNCIA
jgi:hypothetical protein